MKIMRLSWRNYKGLEDGEIVCNGQNVKVVGRNGTGKSSIASILPFILFGKVTGSVMQYVDGVPALDDELIHGAEVTFDDGTTLRREYFRAGQTNRYALYINGLKANTGQYKAAVERLTHEGGEVVVNPFAFCQMSANEQWQVLIRKLSSIRDEDLLSTEFADLGKKVNGGSVGVYQTFLKAKIKNVSAELGQIPARVEELNRQLDPDVTLGKMAEALSAIEERLKSAKEQQAQLSKQKVRDINVELLLLQKQLTEAKRRRVSVREERKWLQEQLEDLREEYVSVREAADVCPTCGQSLPKNFKSTRAEKLAGIVKRGQKCKTEVERREEILADLGAECTTLENKIAELRKTEPIQEAQTLTERITRLDNEIYSLTARKAHCQTQTAVLHRISALHDQERDMTHQLEGLRADMDEAQRFRYRKVELIEQTINSHFEHVRFKMFNILVTTGEVRATCEATLNGVPYVALSKGERYKAALDIFRTLQKVYGVELPVMLDDAESYTSNSRIGIPNQIFAFKVADSDLRIEVIKASCAA